LNDVVARLAELSPKRRELLLRQIEEKRRKAAGGAAGPERIPRQPRAPEGDRFPVSFSQLREWILDQLEPGNPAYNIPGGLRVEGPLDLAAFTAAVNEIVRRHEALRTTFAARGKTESGEPVQVIAPELRVSVPLVDLHTLPAAARETEAGRLTSLLQRLSFDLARGPLLRLGVLRLEPRDHIALFTLHHIVSDGWSVSLFLREVFLLYQAFSLGQPSPLPELPVQYVDYAVWQRGWLQGEVLAEHRDWWRRQLAGAPPLLTLPTDRPRPPLQTFRGAAVPVAPEPDLLRSLRALGHAEGGSLFMVLLAGFQALLARYSGQDDVSVGTYTGSRGRTELEGLIGFFINTLVLRSGLEDGPGFRALLGRVRETTLGAFAHQELPFEKLLDLLEVRRDLSHAPLFQALLVLQNFPAETVEVPGSEVRLTGLTFPGDHTDFDVSLWLWERGDGVSGKLEYNRDLFEAATAERMARHLLALLREAARDPETPTHELPLLDAAERRQLLVEWSGSAGVTAAPAPLVHEQVAASASSAASDTVAVEADGRRMTYRELTARATALARHLQRMGVGPEVRVGVLAERTPEVIAGLLGVLAAGGAYVPLDPSHPEERLAWMLSDAQAPVLLVPGGAETPAWAGNARVVSLDTVPSAEPLGPNPPDPPLPSPPLPPGEGGKQATEQATPVSSLGGGAPLPAVGGAMGEGTGVRSSVDPQNAAYVIYTSGSTGWPKGVVVEHRSLAAYTRDAIAAYEIGPRDRALQLASLGFDTSAEEIWPALAAGATLVLRDAEMIASVPRFVFALDELGITLLNLPTAWWHDLADGLDGAPLPKTLRRVVIGGEKARSPALSGWRRSMEGEEGRIALVNTYGPTEATIVSTRWEIAKEAPAAEIPIGRPIAGARVYVVDSRSQPVPPGVAGELWIGGAGLARGYLGRPEATAAVFVPDPFGEEVGARLYRSGDLVRFRGDRSEGVLEFLGRIDQQVKVRGFRIEPGEIEGALAAHPQVRAGAVVLREDAPGGPGLVAYAVAEGAPPSVSELRRHLAARLPEAWIPGTFVFLEALPLTPNGKLDRRALPAPEGGRPLLERGFVAPETEVEEALAAIWAEVLGLDQVGVQDDFFELGGHSLLATQVVAHVRERLHIDLQLITLFQLPTVEQLAVAVEEAILDRIERLEEEEVQALL
jgi:amino acid adenylation domain-containing protein